mmetsp:Transcript_100323/g.281115  ORF Transcript_100323/g.281115 Transcript_100323/m.281115 type:complete len:386 (-) Transcript_100323:409-1566(-)
MVLLGTFPLLCVRLARHGGQRRLRGLFPHVSFGDGSRHLVLLGGQDGDDVHRADGQVAVQDRLPPCTRARRPWPEDVQELGQRHRSHRGDRRHQLGGVAQEAGGGQSAGQGGGAGEEGAVHGLPRWHPRVRRRRLALRPPRLHAAGPERELGHQPRRGLPPLLQQGLERHTLRPAVLRGRLQVSRRVAVGRAVCVGGPLDIVEAEPLRQGDEPGVGEVRVRQHHHRDLLLLPPRPLRRLPRALEAPVLRRCRAGRQRPGEAASGGGPFHRPRGALHLLGLVHAVDAPIVAVPHRGALPAPPALGDEIEEYHRGSLPDGSVWLGQRGRGEGNGGRGRGGEAVPLGEGLVGPPARRAAQGLRAPLRSALARAPRRLGRAHEPHGAHR